MLYGKRLGGQVVDAGTGQPIAGVHVAYVWESTIIPSGFTGHNSRTICYHAAATTTDSRGHFLIEPWRKWSTYDVLVSDPTALVYAPNYTPRQVVLQEGPIKPPLRTETEFSVTALDIDSRGTRPANSACRDGTEKACNVPLMKFNA